MFRSGPTKLAYFSGMYKMRPNLAVLEGSLRHSIQFAALDGGVLRCQSLFGRESGKKSVGSFNQLRTARQFGETHRWIE
jgi:hypothetical protein